MTTPFQPSFYEGQKGAIRVLKGLKGYKRRKRFFSERKPKTKKQNERQCTVLHQPDSLSMY
jgi:hypothetical protein